MIEIINAVKEFRETVAVNNVTISFSDKKIHGIIGRNGSGKTVLFKCICGLMPLTSGEILVNKQLVRSNKIPRSIGVIIEEPGFLPNLNAQKNLQSLARLRGRTSREMIQYTILRMGLDPNSKKPVSKYSMGMRQRLGIAQAIMENPDILILDEPMNGLDKNGVAEVREILMSLKAEGKTILLASHSSEDIQLLCDTVCEMDAGKLTAIRGFPC